jgi:hypothetical protein
MEAGWLTPEESATVRETGSTTATAMLAASYPDWSIDQRRALLATAMADWATGPLATAHTLCLAADQIHAAWAMRDHIAGVLLVKEDEAFTPLYLHFRTLALKMQTATALWVDFQPIKEAIQ